MASPFTPFRSTILASLVMAAALTIQAQSPAAPSAASGPEKDVLRSYNGLKANILKSADKMPADGYSYKPEPDVRTFARVLNHVTEAQLRSCGALNGTAPDALPKVPPETADKSAIVSALQASFAECDKAYAALTSANLMENVSMGQASRARVSIAWGNVAHDNEQYSALALYLRLKGIAPPAPKSNSLDKRARSDKRSQSLVPSDLSDSVWIADHLPRTAFGRQESARDACPKTIYDARLPSDCWLSATSQGVSR